VSPVADTTPASTPSLWRKRPVTIEAVQFDGTNALAIVAWMGARYVSAGVNGDRLVIVTLEGNMTASPGDWILKGVQGEFYPCKPDIFEATYEAARPDEASS
jgi:hypothetical protein